jgi:hypothetical protein
LAARTLVAFADALGADVDCPLTGNPVETASSPATACSTASRPSHRAIRQSPQEQPQSGNPLQPHHHHQQQQQQLSRFVLLTKIRQWSSFVHPTQKTSTFIAALKIKKVTNQ